MYKVGTPKDGSRAVQGTDRWMVSRVIGKVDDTIQVKDLNQFSHCR